MGDVQLQTLSCLHVNLCSHFFFWTSVSQIKDTGLSKWVVLFEYALSKYLKLDFFSWLLFFLNN